MSLSVRTARLCLSAAAFLAVVVLIAPRTPAVETAPEPRAALKPVELDKTIIAEVKSNSELMKNLQYLSDVIGARLTTSRTFAASNRGTRDNVAPKRIPTLSRLDMPNTWNSGSTTSVTSSARMPNTRPGVSEFMNSWKCVSSAPFGVPVVPDV